MFTTFDVWSPVEKTFKRSESNSRSNEVRGRRHEYKDNSAGVCRCRETNDRLVVLFVNGGFTLDVISSNLSRVATKMKLRLHCNVLAAVSNQTSSYFQVILIEHTSMVRPSVRNDELVLVLDTQHGIP